MPSAPEYAESVDVILGPYYVGDVITYMCMLGTQMTAGTGILECTYLKEWMIDLTCEDINECDVDADNNPCGQNSVCTNTIGSFDCSCLPKYKMQMPASVCVGKLTFALNLIYDVSKYNSYLIIFYLIHQSLIKLKSIEKLFGYIIFFSEIMCPVPMKAINGQFEILSDVTTFRLVDGRIKYICNSGYMMDDGTELETHCTINGEWLHSAPDCKGKLQKNQI